MSVSENELIGKVNALSIAYDLFREEAAAKLAEWQVLLDQLDQLHGLLESIKPSLEAAVEATKPDEADWWKGDSGENCDA